MNIEDLVRPNIKALRPYRSARQDFSTGVLLDANENSCGSAVHLEGLDLNRYPDPFQKQLRSRLAAIHGVELENVFVGVGSDEVIDLLIRVFCEPIRDSIVVLEPTYAMYRVAAEVNNVPARTCLLTDDFQIDLAVLTSTLDDSIKMIFCCSPNNPTGNLLRRNDILEVCRRTSAIVVIDEAYADFAASESLIAAVGAIPNLVVLRTLSKAWGLAGIRLGYGIAQPLIVSYLMKIKAPYNINALTSVQALAGLDNIEHVTRTREAIIMERDKLAHALAQIPYIIRVFPSDANFLLVRCRLAKMVYKQLAERGIIVRDRSSEPKLEQCLRITVGTPEQNQLLIKTMKELQI